MESLKDSIFYAYMKNMFVYTMKNMFISRFNHIIFERNIQDDKLYCFMIKLVKIAFKTLFIRYDLSYSMT